MMQVTLWKKDNEQSGVSLSYVGDEVVLEFDYTGKPTAHYFDTKAEAIGFIIKQAYALLSLGYEVFAE